MAKSILQTSPPVVPLSHFQLSSGRHISYALYGSPAGLPVLFFHGFPGSRLEGAIWHEHALKNNVRLIVPDRPGTGFSSFHPRREIVDWPADVTELLSHLQISSVHALGTAGGSAYLLACLRGLPKRRIRGAAIVSGVFPFSLGGTEGIPFSTRVAIFLAVWLTPLLAVLIDLLLGRPARNPDTAVFEKAFMRDINQRCETDRRCVSEDTDFRTKFVASVRESLRASSWAFAWEARTLSSNWGFEIEELGLESGKGSGNPKLVIWHGRWDSGNPVGLAEEAGKRIEAADLRVLDEGHLSLVARHRDKILKELVMYG